MLTEAHVNTQTVIVAPQDLLAPLAGRLMRQPSRQRLLVHFVNQSGHADTAYFAPITMRDISVELACPIRRATALRLDQELPVTPVGPQRRFTLPRLGAYEVVVLDE